MLSLQRTDGRASAPRHGTARRNPLQYYRCISSPGPLPPYFTVTHHRERAHRATVTKEASSRPLTLDVQLLLMRTGTDDEQNR